MTRARDISSRGGLTQVIPASIVKSTAGTASISANGSVNFSGVDSIALDGAFTSTFQNYKILFTPTHGGSNGGYALKLRASNADNASVYYGAGTNVYVSSSTVSSYRTNGGADFLLGAGSASMQHTFHDILITGPAESRYTGLATTGMAVDGSGSYAYNMNAWHNTLSAMDGFRIYTTAGNITGAIRVYGYNNG